MKRTNKKFKKIIIILIILTVIIGFFEGISFNIKSSAKADNKRETLNEIDNSEKDDIEVLPSKIRTKANIPERFTFKSKGAFTVSFKNSVTVGSNSVSDMQILTGNPNSGNWQNHTNGYNATRATKSSVDNYYYVSYRGYYLYSFSTFFGGFSITNATYNDISVEGSLLALLSYKSVELYNKGDEDITNNGYGVSLNDGYQPLRTVDDFGTFKNLLKDCTQITSASELIMDEPVIKYGVNSFEGMFSGCTNLVQPPKLLVQLPVKRNCYKNMFNGCKNLKSAPLLPDEGYESAKVRIYYNNLNNYREVIVQPENCFYGMFSGCTSLEAPPAIPSSVSLRENCCREMFANCTGLKYAPDLPATSLEQYCYAGMFKNCTALKTPPQLPATTIGEYCYSQMFEGCKSLTSSPIIYASSIENYCCQSMFKNCTSLKTTPTELPATTLKESCYKDMFNGCTRLTSLPVLPATALSLNCYSGMFNNTGIWISNTNTNGTKWMWSATTSNSYYGSSSSSATASMFSNYAVSYNKQYYSYPQYSSSAVAYYINYNNDAKLTFKSSKTFNIEFTNSLTSANATYIEYQTGDPTLSVWNTASTGKNTITASEYSGNYYVSYRGRDISSIYSIIGSFSITSTANDISVEGKLGSLINYKNIRDNIAPASSNNAYKRLFYNNSSIKDASYLNMELCTSYGANAFESLFEGCSNLVNAPELPKKTITSYCYAYAFKNCTSLSSAPNLSATSVSECGYKQMFMGCTNIKNPPTISALTLADNCYESMFSGCTALVTPPSLPAKTLSSYCYTKMFMGCTSLKSVPELSSTSLATGCYEDMFNSCINISTPPKLQSTTLSDSCYKQMFKGCTGLSSLPELPAVLLTPDCYSNMFNNTGIVISDTNIKGKEWIWGAKTQNSYYADGTYTAVESMFSEGSVIFRENTYNYPPYSNTATKYFVSNINNAKVTFKSSFPFTVSFGKALIDIDASNIEIQSGNPAAFSWSVAKENSVNSTDAVKYNDYYYISYRGNGVKSIHYVIDQFVITSSYNDISIEGELASLLDCTKVANGEVPESSEDDIYRNLFYGCTNIKDVSGLKMELATSFGDYGFDSMFFGCTNLETTPEFSTAELTKYCYYRMFQDCTSLIEAPILPSEVLAEYCYDNMFSGCTSLTVPPILLVETLKPYCYRQMFYNCTNLEIEPNLPATTLAKGCYEGMFASCTSLTTSPELSATTLQEDCYKEMFKGCTNLTTLPDLPATSLPQGCYSGMFKDIEIKISDEYINGTEWTWNATKESNYYGKTKFTAVESMFSDNSVTYNEKKYSYPPYLTKSVKYYVRTLNDSKVTFKSTSSFSVGFSKSITSDDASKIEIQVGNPYRASWTKAVANSYNDVHAIKYDGYYYISYRATNVSSIYSAINKFVITSGNDDVNVIGEIASLLDYTKTVNNIAPSGGDNAYKSIFEDCSAISDASELSFDLATSFGNNAFDSMFSGCTNIETAPELPMTKLTNSCYSSMFLNCTSLRTAPELSVTSLKEYCYNAMFSGCINLENGPELPAQALANSCYSSMFEGCIGLKTPPVLQATKLANSCYSSMFKGCTTLTTTPDLPATTLANSCYNSMFKGCTALTTLPDLPAKSLVSDCYNGMFGGIDIRISDTYIGGTEWIWTSKTNNSYYGNSTYAAVATMFSNDAVRYNGQNYSYPPYATTNTKYYITPSKDSINATVPIDESILTDDNQYSYDGTTKFRKVEVADSEANSISIKYSLNTSTEYVEADILKSDVINAGTYTVNYIATDITGFYSDAIGSYNITVNKINMPDDIISVTDTERIYNGEAQTPVVELESLISGKSPTVTYSTSQNGSYSSELPSLINPESEKIWYKLVDEEANYNDYIGSFDFKIKKADITDGNIKIVSTFVANSTVYTPQITVSLINDASYTVRYYENDNYLKIIDTPSRSAAGTTPCWFTINDNDGNYNEYKGEFNLIVTNKIIEYEATGETVTYDGENHLGIIEVSNPSDGYTIKYSEDKNGNYTQDLDLSRAGEYTLWFKIEAEDYTEVVDHIQIIINKKSIDPKSVTFNSKFTYDGTKKSPEVIASIINNSPYTVSYYTDQGYTQKTDPSQINAGEYPYYFTIEDNANNYNIYKGYLKLQIDKVSMVYAKSDETYIYDGDNHYGNIGVVTPESDYVITYSTTKFGNYISDLDVKNVGTHILWFKITSPNYIDVVDFLTVKINKATISDNIANIPDTNRIYDGNFLTPTVILKTLPDGTYPEVTYSASKDGTYSPKLPSYKNADSYTVWYKMADERGNYEEKTGGSFVFTINKAQIEDEDINIESNYIYDGTDKTPNITVTLINNAEYTVKYYLDNTYSTIVSPSRKNAGSTKYWFTVNADNYNEYRGSFDLNITEGAIVYKAQGEIVNYDGNTHLGTIEVIEPSDGYLITYSTSENGKYTEDLDISNVGDYEVWFKISASNYPDTIGKLNVTINKIKIKDDDVSVVSEFEYNGQPQYPKITASLINNADYMVKYYSDFKFTKEIDIPQITDLGKSKAYYYTITDNDGNYEIYKGTFTLVVNEAVSPKKENKNIYIYRLYNPNTTEHLFTSKLNEYNKLPASGWIQEGVTFDAYAEDDKPDDAEAIYRVYNPNVAGGDHHYTKSTNEIMNLVSKGWIQDNGGNPLFYAAGDIKVYKLYEKKTGRHHYTPKTGERSTMLKSGSWVIDGNSRNLTGIAWYVNAYYLSDGTRKTE